MEKISGGEAVFAAACSTCHQPNGVGVRGAVPPLNDPAFMEPAVLTAVILRGVEGPIRVGRETFDGAMPGFAGQLTDQDIANVASYVRRTWGGADAGVDPGAVARARAQAAGAGPWRGGRDLTRVSPALLPQPAWSGPAPLPVDGAVLALINEGRGEALACSSCHGPQGQGGDPIPRLAGLPADYIAAQLDAFAAGRRRNDQMSGVARALGPTERRALADYYSRLAAPSTATPSLDGDRALGERLALRGDWSRDIPACFACHGPSGFGGGPRLPALAAQHPGYTAAQLSAWASGQRTGDPGGLMGEVAGRLSEQDRRAIADYLAGLPSSPATVPRNRR
ncbi:MAG: c-type cytochrome [Caulobacter sp.]|nr:c-type cytochrome [Caulobacter sp.]